MTYGKNDIDKVAQEIIKVAKSEVICLYGPMGAGKTTLIKFIVKELGGIDEVSSPTFGIVNEYHKKDGSVLGYHFDFYRLEDETEVLDFGFEDYLNQKVWIFIEWPEKISSFLPEETFNIHIDMVDSTTRKILLE